MQGASNDERSKFLGSQGFIGSCSTMIGFEQHPKDPKMRNVTVMGRNFANLHLKYSLGKQGEYVLEINNGEVVETDEDRYLQLTLWVQNQKEPFRVLDAVAFVMREAIEMSDATVERWLTKQATDEDGLLQRWKIEGKGRAYWYSRRGSKVMAQ